MNKNLLIAMTVLSLAPTAWGNTSESAAAGADNLIATQRAAVRAIATSRDEAGAQRLQEYVEKLTNVNESITVVREGLSGLAQTPVEMAGVVILYVPGPYLPIKSPSQAEVLELLRIRRMYWEANQGAFQQSMDSLSWMLDAKNKTLDKAQKEELSRARKAVMALVSVVQNDIIADIDQDKQYVANGFPVADANALINRKTILLRDKIIPALEKTRDFLRDTVIPMMAAAQ